MAAAVLASVPRSRLRICSHSVCFGRSGSAPALAVIGSTLPVTLIARNGSRWLLLWYGSRQLLPRRSPVPRSCSLPPSGSRQLLRNGTRWPLMAAALLSPAPRSRWPLFLYSNQKY